MTTRFLSLAILVGLSAAPSLAAGDSPSIPPIAMPDTVYRTLRKGLDSMPKQSVEQRAAKLAALDRLREIGWPDLRKFQRVHLFDAKEPKRFVNAWRQQNNNEVIYLLDDFKERRQPLADFSRVVVYSYADELAEIVAYLKETGEERRRPWNFTHLFGEGLPYHGGAYLIHHAYAAASLGKHQEAAFLVHEALKQRSSAFEQTYQEKAWQSFFHGVNMLEKGDTRADVLKHWNGTLKDFGKSSYRNQLEGLVGELTKQVEEDKKLAKQAVKDPEKLLVEQRIAYYLARFPDVHGAQWSAPGHCRTIGLGEGTKFSDALVKIGRPAVPALIEHLTDTRVTRSIGFQRPFYSHRVVLRVQDVAVQCIEAIVDIRFYHPTSTSSYLSNESVEKREKVIADIKKWWQDNGHKTPVEGYVARLETGHLWDKLDTLRKIEALDKKAVDSIATLRRWAAQDYDINLTEIGEELARRGDLSLVPIVRHKESEPFVQQPIWLLLRRGDAADFRFLREEARKELAAGKTLGSSRFLSALAAGLQSSDRPLAVPLLVDFLGERSSADRCIEALIRITGHDEGYKRGADDKQRYAAIDRWHTWWQKEGEAAFLKKHPEVRAVNTRAPVVEVATLPPLVRVHTADRSVPVTYDVPRDDVARFLNAGTITATPADEGFVFRFATTKAAESWFAQAKPVHVAKDERDRKPLLTRIANDRARGVVCGKDGRTWFWDWGELPVAELKQRVETAYQNEGPHAIIGVEELFVDSKARVWVLPSYPNQGMLLAYDPATKKWIERRPEGKGNMMRDPIFEDKAGRIYVGDLFGVHVLDGAAWTYQRRYERNLKEKRFSKNERPFAPLEFAQDPDGRVYVWSHWLAGTEPPVGTIGYWMHDGKSWRNENPVEKIRAIIPRGERVWIFGEDENLSLVENGVHLTGEKAHRALHRRLRFHRAALIVEDRKGTAYLGLTEVVDVETFARHSRGVVLALPAKGDAWQVPQPVAWLMSQDHYSILSGYSRFIVPGLDQTLWLIADGMVQAVTPADGGIRAWPQTKRFTWLQMRAVDAAGRPCFQGSGPCWRLDPTQPARLDDRNVHLPAMRVSLTGEHGLDSRGRMWCTFNATGAMTATFDGATWKTHPDASADKGTGDPELNGYISTYRGANGAMIFEDRYGRFDLFDDQGWVRGRSAVELALKHPNRLRKGLAYPPPPADNRYHKLVKDAKGRIWWSDWTRSWGVIDGENAIDGKTCKSINLGPHYPMWELAPIGDGTRVLACTEDGQASVLDVINGRIVEVAKPPVPMSGSRILGHYATFRDSDGRLWICQNHTSQAIDVKGKAAEEVPGYLLVEDRRKGLWFREEKENRVVLVRRDPAGKTLRLEVPDLLVRDCVAAAPDGSVWALTRLELLRIRADDKSLTIIERYPLRVNADRIWCDARGRVWHETDSGSGSQRGSHLVLYAVP